MLKESGEKVQGIVLENLEHCREGVRTSPTGTPGRAICSSIVASSGSRANQRSLDPFEVESTGAGPHWASKSNKIYPA